MKKYNHKKLPTFIKKLILVLILSFLCSFLLIKYYNTKLTPLLLNYADTKTREIALKVMNKAYSEEISSNYPTNLFNITRSSSNEIELINYDTKAVSELLGKISSHIEKYLHHLESGNVEELGMSGEELNTYYGNGLIYTITLGSATNNIFLSNLGPKIPLKLKLNKDIVTGVKISVQDYGLNNALIELDLTIEANMQIFLPFTSKVTTITFNTPLSIELINGKIPNYYQPGLEYKNTQ